MSPTTRNNARSTVRLIRFFVAALGLAALLYASRVVIAPGRGLQAEYFASELPGGKPVLSGVDAVVSTDRVQRRWYGAMPDTFSAQWFGYLFATSSGRYTFALTSDDAAVLSVDGRRLIDNGGRHAATTRTADIELSRGPHAVLIEFTQYGGDFAIEWRWGRDARSLFPVPSWATSPYKAPSLAGRRRSHSGSGRAHRSGDGAGTRELDRVARPHLVWTTPALGHARAVRGARDRPDVAACERSRSSEPSRQSRRDVERMDCGVGRARGTAAPASCLRRQHLLSGALFGCLFGADVSAGGDGTTAVCGRSVAGAGVQPPADRWIRVERMGDVSGDQSLDRRLVRGHRRRYRVRLQCTSAQPHPSPAGATRGVSSRGALCARCPAVETERPSRRVACALGGPPGHDLRVSARIDVLRPRRGHSVAAARLDGPSVPAVRARACRGDDGLRRWSWYPFCCPTTTPTRISASPDRCPTRGCIQPPGWITCRRRHD